jgi:hypothetical protein
LPGRNPQEAWRNFKEPIQRVVGCVDLSSRLVEREFDDGRRLLAGPSNGIAFGPSLSLTFSLQLEPIEEAGDWRMTTRRYDFTLTQRTKPAELTFGWHWHPASRRSQVVYPHVHVPSAATFSTKHIPTGRVSLEDVILFGFAELGVPPANTNAEKIVAEVRDRHKQYRSWH